jgi:hypothetical protein
MVRFTFGKLPMENNFSSFGDTLAGLFPLLSVPMAERLPVGVVTVWLSYGISVLLNACKLGENMTVRFGQLSSVQMATYWQAAVMITQSGCGVLALENA